MTDVAAYPDGLAEFCGVQIGRGFAPDLPLGGFALDMARVSVGFGIGGARHLEGMGVPRGFIMQLLDQYDLARARVSVGRAGLFEWDGSEMHLLIGVREFGVLIDVCAVRSSAPDEWALLRGEGWALGLDVLMLVQAGAADRLRLFGTPFDWLRSGGDGICVLDWTAAALGALRGLGSDVTLMCDDDRAAQRLGAMLSYSGLPRVASAPKRRIAA